MGGFGDELGASSAYEDDNAFEEQESAKKPQSAADQVYPRETFNNVLKSVVIVTKPDPIATHGGGGVSDENEEDGDGGYSADDDFECGTISSSSSSKESAPAWSDTLRAKSEDRVSPAAPVGKNVDDDEVTVASEAAAPAWEDQAAGMRSENDVAKTEVNLASIHAHRDDPAMLPPPAPSSADPASQHARAAIAAKRVVEYKELQIQNQAQQAAEAAAIEKKREQFRASKQKVYKQMGVSKLTGEQRYQLLVEEKKLLREHHAAREKLEEHQRWYNARAVERNSGSRQECLASAHVAELQARSRETSRQRFRDTVGRAQIVKTQQVELHKQANAIVAKHTHTEYVRGSYLLKQTPQEAASNQDETSEPSTDKSQRQHEVC